MRKRGKLYTASATAVVTGVAVLAAGCTGNTQNTHQGSAVSVPLQNVSHNSYDPIFVRVGGVDNVGSDSLKLTVNCGKGYSNSTASIKAPWSKNIRVHSDGELGCKVTLADPSSTRHVSAVENPYNGVSRIDISQKKHSSSVKVDEVDMTQYPFVNFIVSPKSSPSSKTVSSVGWSYNFDMDNQDNASSASARVTFSIPISHSPKLGLVELENGQPVKRTDKTFHPLRHQQLALKTSLCGKSKKYVFGAWIGGKGPVTNPISTLRMPSNPYCD
jgi:hypothetical protein